MDISVIQIKFLTVLLKKSAVLTGQFLSPDIDYTNVKLVPEQKFNFLVIYQVFIKCFLSLNILNYLLERYQMHMIEKGTRRYTVFYFLHILLDIQQLHNVCISRFIPSHK